MFNRKQKRKTTEEALTETAKIAEANGDLLVTACIYAIHGFFVAGEIKAITDVVIDETKAKMGIYKTDQHQFFPKEI